jgi:hypothetical protein
VVASAVSGDIVDLRGLSCAAIQLSENELVVVQENLTLLGAGAAVIAIEPSAASRVVSHIGSGTLTLTGLTIRNGNLVSATDAQGGCIRSNGDVTLVDVVVALCAAAGDLRASGGGLFVTGNLDMKASVIRDNRAIKAGTGSTAFPSVRGGGAAAHDISAIDSTISANSAEDPNGELARGGGLDYDGGSFIRRSTIDHNSANYGGGLAGVGGSTDVIFRSTVSNNVATVAGGGIYGNAFFNIHQSTVAYNAGSATGAGGIHMQFGVIDVLSSIVANNQPTESAGADVAADAMKSFNLSAEYSIIMRTKANILGKILTGDPLLGPLADNGGLTQTHALMKGSPALQAGWNITSPCDQRQRLRGYQSDADIGAYEDPGDHLFQGNFDVCY